VALSASSTARRVPAHRPPIDSELVAEAREQIDPAVANAAEPKRRPSPTRPWTLRLG
jgi:hypothetical protein